MSSTLLLIEDSLALGQGLQTFLQQEGYRCPWHTDVHHLDAAWFAADLVILDRQLPSGDSLLWLPQWLAKKALPVIVLTARVSVEDRVSGLEAGARDYLCKPFSHSELLARIRAQLRPTGDGVLRVGELSLNPSRKTVCWQQQTVALSSTEFALLWTLAQMTGRVFSRDELLNRAWGYQHFPTTRTVDTHVMQLRQKLPGIVINSVRGVGYRLDIPA